MTNLIICSALVSLLCLKTKDMTKLQGLKPSPKTILQGEIWLEIPDYPNYEVSNFGRVYSRKYKRIMSPSNRPDGRLSVKLRNPIARSIKVHRLVGVVFIPNPDSKPEIDHIDCNPKNNHVSNLRWVTHQENCSVVYQRGRKKVTGELAVTAKLTNQQASQVREWFANKTKTVKQMSCELSISEQSLRAIIKKETYPC